MGSIPVGRWWAGWMASIPVGRWWASWITSTVGAALRGRPSSGIFRLWSNEGRPRSAAPTVDAIQVGSGDWQRKIQEGCGFGAENSKQGCGIGNRKLLGYFIVRFPVPPITRY